MLSGAEIIRRAKVHDGIIISDFDEKRVGPNSYNMRLYPELQVYTEFPLDMAKKNPTKKIPIRRGGIILEPGTLYLGRTIEGTATRGLVPCIDGRSSVGRLGTFVHITAGFGDNGYESDFWTLEITPVHPIRVYGGVEICQLYYEPIEGDQSIMYHGKYQNNDIMASELYREFK